MRCASELWPTRLTDSSPNPVKTFLQSVGSPERAAALATREMSSALPLRTVAVMFATPRQSNARLDQFAPSLDALFSKAARLPGAAALTSWSDQVWLKSLPRMRCTCCLRSVSLVRWSSWASASRLGFGFGVFGSPVTVVLNSSCLFCRRSPSIGRCLWCAQRDRVKDAQRAAKGLEVFAFGPGCPGTAPSLAWR